MLAPPTDNLRVIRYARNHGYSAVEWQAAFMAIDWLRDAEPLKDGAKGSVWRAPLTLGGRELACVVKVQRLGGLGQVLKSKLHQTKAWRQWRGAALLESCGIQTSPPLAVLRSQGAEMLVLGYLAGDTVLECVAGGLSVEDERVLGDAVAGTIGAMWDAGLMHRDLKPSNLVCVPGYEHRLGVIDTEGVRRLKQSPTLGPALGLNQPMIRQMLVTLYLELAGCGLTPRAALCRRVCEAVQRKGETPAGPGNLREAWRAMAEAIRNHGDPAPKDDPLRRPSIG